jgi:ribA/ribD-fused uncharacterized protein
MAQAAATSSAPEHNRQSDPAIFFFKEHEVPHGCFSQWYQGTFTDPESGLDFNCAEQWMMWNKAKMAGDEAVMRELMETISPRKQKALGRQVANFDSAEWDRIKFDVVVRGNWLKFTQADDAAYCRDGQEPTPLQNILLDTGSSYLCEASPFDHVWGIGFSAVKASEMRSKWGQNLLGRALCVVREQIRNEGNEGQPAAA